MADPEEAVEPTPKSPVDADLDPRIKEELDVLNITSEEINKLETELESARAQFRSLLGHATQRLDLLYRKLGRAVTKARPYYDLMKQSKKAQGEAQRSVVKFHRAFGIYQAAKETVKLAEARLVEGGKQREFDSAWQEMLNHATIKFMDSEKEKTQSEQEHLERASQVTAIERRMKALEKSMPRTIPRSKPYFDLKERLEYQLQQEKVNVEDLVRALNAAKVRYRGALHTLEAISEEVHMKRRLLAVLPPRTPGVGAEHCDCSSDIPPINLDINSETSGDVMSINSDDYDMISTDGSEGGDSLDARSNPLPISPLALPSVSHALSQTAKSHSNKSFDSISPTDSLSTATDIQESGKSPMNKRPAVNGMDETINPGDFDTGNKNMLTTTTYEIMQAVDNPVGTSLRPEATGSSRSEATGSSRPEATGSSRSEATGSSRSEATGIVIGFRHLALDGGAGLEGSFQGSFQIGGKQVYS